MDDDIEAAVHLLGFPGNPHANQCVLMLVNKRKFSQPARRPMHLTKSNLWAVAIYGRLTKEALRDIERFQGRVLPDP
jgi:hypothetical protein